jgi:hypothetical protein
MEYLDIRELQKQYGGLGQFVVAKLFLLKSDPALLQAIFFGMIILSAEHNWEGNAIIYRGFHPDFKEIEKGAVVTDYKLYYAKEYEEDDDLAGNYHYRIEWKEISRT